MVLNAPKNRFYAVFPGHLTSLGQIVSLQQLIMLPVHLDCYFASLSIHLRFLLHLFSFLMISEPGRPSREHMGTWRMHLLAHTT